MTEQEGIRLVEKPVEPATLADAERQRLAFWREVERQMLCLILYGTAHPKPRPLKPRD